MATVVKSSTPEFHQGRASHASSTVNQYLADAPTTEYGWSKSEICAELAGQCLSLICAWGFCSVQRPDLNLPEGAVGSLEDLNRCPNVAYRPHPVAKSPVNVT